METITEILIDLSDSMNDKLEDGTSKIALTQRIILEEILPALNYSHGTTIQTFKTDQSGQTIVEELLDLSDASHDNLINAIQNLSRSHGSAHVGSALVQSVKRLMQYRDMHTRIILLTDADTLNNFDYQDIVEAAIDMVHCRLFIIGIGALATESERTARAIAAYTRGTFVNVGARKISAKIVHSELEPLKIALLKEAPAARVEKNNPVEVQQRGSEQEYGEQSITRISNLLNSATGRRSGVRMDLAPAIKLHIVSNIIDDYLKAHHKLNVNLEQLFLDYDDFVQCIPAERESEGKTLLVVEYFDTATRESHVKEALERVRTGKGAVKRILFVTREWNSDVEATFTAYSRQFRQAGLLDISVKVEGFPLFRKI